MNPLIIYAACIIIGLFIVKLIAENLFRLLSKWTDAISRSASKIAIFLGVVLIVMAYAYPLHAEKILTDIRTFIRSLI